MAKQKNDEPVGVLGDRLDRGEKQQGVLAGQSTGVGVAEGPSAVAGEPESGVKAGDEDPGSVIRNSK